MILLRILLFGFVFWWILKGISRFLFGSLSQQQANQRNFNGGGQQRQKQAPRDGNVNIDYAPKDQKTKKSSDNFKGGDYVDYEEVD